MGLQKGKEEIQKQRAKDETLALLNKVLTAVQDQSSIDSVADSVREVAQTIEATIAQIELPETDLSAITQLINTLVRNLDKKFDIITAHLLDLQKAEWKVDVSRDKEKNISQLYYKRMR